MGLRSFLSSSVKMLKLTTKPSREEFWLSIKICLVGISLIGIIGFIIRFISAMLQGFVPPP